jgi:predicted phage terminase large subunit-like protein
VCVILQVRGETVFVLDVFRDRLEYPELKRKAMEWHHRWRNWTDDYALLIENKGSGMSLIQDLKREHIHAIAVEPEGDKTIRMIAQSARIEAGSVRLPQRAPWLDEFRQELLAFPASRHTDQIDAFSQALNHAFSARRGMSWDIALSETESGDYSACVVLLRRREVFYVLEVIRRRFPFETLKRKVMEVKERYGSAATLLIGGLSDQSRPHPEPARAIRQCHDLQARYRQAVSRHCADGLVRGRLGSFAPARGMA